MSGEDPFDTDYLKDVKFNPKVMSNGEYMDCKKAFAYLDKDKSRKISTKELKQELNKLEKEIKEEFPEFDSSEIIDIILEQCDENKDGEIDLQEFISIMQAEPINDMTKRENTDKVYKEFIRHGDLTAKNLSKIAEGLGDSGTDVERMIFFADTNDDGIVDEDEFYYILNPDKEKLKERAKLWKEYSAKGKPTKKGKK
ncbi:MAG: EF-hand domain-containing protein [archaeon]|nr:EF-hand domain-containing protein [archaeon]